MIGTGESTGFCADGCLCKYQIAINLGHFDVKRSGMYNNMCILNIAKFKTGYFF